MAEQDQVENRNLDEVQASISFRQEVRYRLEDMNKKIVTFMDMYEQWLRVDAANKLKKHEDTLYGDNVQWAGLVSVVRNLKENEARREKLLWAVIVGIVGLGLKFIYAMLIK